MENKIIMVIDIPLMYQKIHFGQDLKMYIMILKNYLKLKNGLNIELKFLINILYEV